MKVDEMKQLIQAVSESKLDEFDYEEKDVKLHMSKRPKHHPEHGPKPPMPGQVPPMPGQVPPMPGQNPPMPGMCPPPETAGDTDHKE